MARLSVEHFRANSVMTPEKSRKSSRLRDMFKSRSSLSPSTTTDKRRDSADVSPLTSPTLKTGFEKVGLLPSERNSLAPTEKDPKVAHDPKDTLGANDTPEAMSTIAEKTEKQPEMVSSKTSNSLDDAFRELFEKHQKECAKDEAEASEQGTSKPVDGLSTDNSQRLYVLRPSDEMSNPSGNSNGTRTKILLANKNDPQVTDLRRNHEIDDDGTSRYDSKRHSQTAFVDFSRSVDRDETFVDSEADRVRLDKRDSFASNIFDNDDSLSQGIREYVKSKIAEAKVQAEQEQHSKAQTTIDALHVTLEIHIHSLNLHGIDNNKHSFEDFSRLFRGPKSIGSHTINNDCVAKALQGIVLALYGFLAICALLTGPYAVLSLATKLMCLLGAYIGASGLLGCSLDKESDILLGPVLSGVRGGLRLTGRALRVAGLNVASFVVETGRSQIEAAVDGE